MIKISYGSNRLDELIPSFEGVLLYDGEFLDLINIDDRDYLVTRIINSAYKNDGNIRVDEVIVDLFSNGDKDIYANKEKSSDARRLEEIFNEKDIKDFLREGKLQELLKGAGMQVKQSLHSIMEDKTVIVIKNDVFEKYRTSIINNDKSFTNLLSSKEDK